MFRLALALGCTINELYSRISLEEFTEWLVYYGEEPWGAKLDGMRDASLTAAVYNAGLMVANPKQLKEKPFNPDQFFIGVKKDDMQNPSDKNVNTEDSLENNWKQKQQMFMALTGSKVRDGNR